MPVGKDQGVKRVLSSKIIKKHFPILCLREVFCWVLFKKNPLANENRIYKNSVKQPKIKAKAQTNMKVGIELEVEIKWEKEKENNRDEK